MSDTLIPRWPAALSTEYRNNSAHDNGTVINGSVGHLTLHSYPKDRHDLHDSSDVNEYFLVPHQLSPIFTGRQELVDKLKAALWVGKDPIEFEILVRSTADLRFWAIFWIDLSSEITAAQGFGSIPLGQYKNSSRDLIENARYALASLSRPWLLVLDNADNPHLDINRYLPPGNRGSILIISRNAKLGSYASLLSFEVGELPENDSISLFLKACDPETCEDRDLAKKITSELGKASAIDTSMPVGLTMFFLGGNLPLAIAHAGSVVRSARLSIRDFRGLLSRSKNKTLGGAQDYGLNINHVSVYALWDMSIGYISEPTNIEDRSLGADALELFSLLSLFSYRGTPVEMFARAWTAYKSLCLLDNEVFCLPRVLQACQGSDGEWDGSRFWRAVDRLGCFSLIAEGKSNLFTRQLNMHPLVHSWAQYRLNQDGEAKNRLQKMALMLIGLAAHENTSVVRRFGLLLQLESCMAHTEDSQRSSKLKSIDDIIMMTNYFGHLGQVLCHHLVSIIASYRPKDAEPYLHSFYEDFLATNGENHQLTISAMQSLRDCLARLFKWTPALELDRKLVRIQKQSFGPRSVQTMSSQLGVADDLQGLGSYEDAKVILNEMLLFLNDPENENQSTLEGVRIAAGQRIILLGFILGDCSHGLVLRDSTQAQTQSPGASRAMADVEKFSEKLKMVTVVSTTTCEHKRRKLALQGYHESKKYLGQDHPMTEQFFTIANDTAMYYSIDQSMNRWLTETKVVSVRPLDLNSVLDSVAQRLGHDHIITLKHMISAAVCPHHNREDLIGAVALFRQAIQLSRDAKSRYDVSTYLMIRTMVADGHGALAKLTKATHKNLSLEFQLAMKQDFLEIIPDVTKIFGAAHRRTIGTIVWFAARLSEAGEYDGSCKTLALALTYLQTNDISGCGERYSLRDQIGRNLIFSTGKAKQVGDRHAGELLLRVASNTDCRRRSDPGWKYMSACKSCCSDPATSSNLIDGDGVIELMAYWQYRRRASDFWTEDIRESLHSPRSISRLTDLVTTLWSVVMPYQDLAQDWRSDLIILCNLSEELVSLRLEKFGITDRWTLSEIHFLLKIYSNLNDLKEGLETQFLLAKVEILKRVWCCKVKDLGRNYHRLEAEKLLKRLYTHEALEAKMRTGMFRRVLEESCLFAVKSTLYIANGFIWEAWLDERLEDQEMEKRSIMAQGARNILTGRRGSFDWLALPTWSFSKVWDQWRMQKEKLD